MNRADRLLKRVQMAYGCNDKQLSIGFVTPVKEGEHQGKWEARADLWDGKHGSRTPEDSTYSYHESIEEAVQAIRAVEETHNPIGNYKPLFDKVPILIDDIPEDDSLE